MNTPLHHLIRPGIVQFMAHPSTMGGEGPILESWREILADPYFEVIEVSWIKDPAVRQQARELLASAGVDARFGAYPRQLSQKLDLNSADAGESARAVAGIREAIDEAGELGIRDVGILSGFDVGPDERSAAMDRLVLSVRDICAYAADRNVQVALEVFDRSVDKKCLIGPASAARELSERVKETQENFGLIVDLSHTVLLGETPEEALIPVKEHLVHVHIGNAYFGADRSDPYWGDHHPSFGYPGSPNDVPQIAAFLRVLFAIGYLDADASRRGAISFEIKPMGGIDSRVMIANAKRKLQAAWAALQISELPPPTSR